MILVISPKSEFLSFIWEGGYNLTKGYEIFFKEVKRVIIAGKDS
jgi:hypothetical protein